MISKPKDPRPIGEEDDSYLKPGMKDENESTHKVGRPTPVKPMPVKKNGLVKGVKPMPVKKNGLVKGVKPMAGKVRALREAMIRKSK